MNQCSDLICKYENLSLLKINEQTFAFFLSQLVGVANWNQDDLNFLPSLFQARDLRCID